jgi:hypothetical protein
VEHPDVDLCLIVDDLAIHAFGSESHVAVVLPQMVQCCIGEPEDDLDLRISRGVS